MCHQKSETILKGPQRRNPSQTFQVIAAQENTQENINITWYINQSINSQANM